MGRGLQKKEARKAHSVARMHRVMRLRAMGAPLIIIKSEQINMVCNRKGVKGEGNAMANALRERYFGDSD